MNAAETRNLLTHEHEPSEDTVEEGLAAHTPSAEGGFESTRKRSWFIRLSDAFPIRRLTASGFWRLILGISLLFGCVWLAIWMFWPTGKLPSGRVPLAVR